MRKIEFKKITTVIACFCLIFSFLILNINKACADEEDIKAEAYALYNTNNINEALKLLENLPHGETALDAEGSTEAEILCAVSFVMPGGHQLPVGFGLCFCSAAPPGGSSPCLPYWPVGY